MEGRLQFYTVQSAAERLGVTRNRIWAMLKNGDLTAQPNPIDRRERLIPAEQIEGIAELMAGIKKAAA